MRFIFSLHVCLLLLLNACKIIHGQSSVSFSSMSDDPCYNYEALDRPWRSTTESGLWICDNDFSWSGWYRLFHYGMNIQMPESCINPYSCNAEFGLWLNGSHPHIEDGVVMREVCGATSWGGNCCDLKSEPVKLKACPGNYYVYELLNPLNAFQYWCAGYCTDVSSISKTASTTTTALILGSSFT
ncbi:pancreatic secretory granule membrane major glycoprotein GP2-like [Triplophysa dalaica]|uniref:pancreatic secretory granule membrane major glycoprotein GP2-like n=1 Tax=Triplophysa dalaica TaxID=1582913 RepID=UPI0024DFAE3A|nr:pancreatic secretory granule membrane major glycoprotein GP2-like [Triplophysa dalaica]